MDLKLRHRAVRDLVEIRNRLLDRAGEQAADSVRRHLAKRIERVRLKPDLGISSDHPDVRILSPTKYPYRIYFMVTDRAVIILHVRHTARRAIKLESLVRA
jgi:toxin ParE1/3/4